MTMLLDVTIRSSAVLAAGLLLRACCRHRSAAVRHAIVAGALFAAAAVAPLTLVVPAWPLPLPVRLDVSTAVRVEPARVEGPSAPVTVVAERPTSRRAPASAAVLLWLAGMGITAAVAALAMTRLVRVTRRARRVRDERWTSLMAALLRRHRLGRSVALLQTRAPDILATWGVFRPCVLLPAHARDWSDERRHLVLCHELAHIRRHDWLVQIGAEALRIVYWFNPLVWIACAALRRDSEQACDDAVIEAGVPPRAYATHLLQLARICRPPLAGAALPMASARTSTLERRITTMLTPHIDRRRLTPRALIATALLLTAITVPAAALRPDQTTRPLKGTVYDPSGAVLPDVSLTLEDAQQNKLEATTDANGHFEFPSVGPGSYVLEASLAGFRKLRNPVDLSTSADWDRAVTLQVGQVQESIMVRARRPSGTSAAATAAAPVRVGGNIRAPRKLHDVRPVYPASMRDAGREGVVPLEAIIGRDGTVTSVRVVSAQVHPDFAAAAMDAVREWRFAPTLLNGEPVEVVMTVSVSFKLSD